MKQGEEKYTDLIVLCHVIKQWHRVERDELYQMAPFCKDTIMDYFENVDSLLDL